MSYLTAKENRVEKNWNKRGIAGLRTELLDRVRDKDVFDWDDSEFVLRVCSCVYSLLPAREWSIAEQLIAETCGLGGVDIWDDLSSGVDERWSTMIMRVRLNEETLREDIGDE